MKKLLILGAGIYQVPLIRCAKKMGIYTIAVSTPGIYPGFGVADQAAYIDTTDKEAVLELSQREQITGICTTGTDVAIQTLGYVCDHLNLPGITLQSAQIVSDKLRMKEAFLRENVRTAKYRKVSTLSDCYDAFDALAKPVIFKAIDSSGSRGIIRVDDRSFIEHAFSIVMKTTHKNFFLIEEFIIGEEFGATGFVRNGELQFILLHGEVAYKGDTYVPIGHYAPYDISDAIKQDCYSQLERCVKAASLNTCALDFDCIMKEGKMYTIEMGARAGATCIVELVSIYYGFDFYETLIRAAMGMPLNISFEGSTPNASMLLLSHCDGVITQIVNANIEDENIIDIQFDYVVGDAVRKFHVGPDRIGHVITKGSTLQEAYKRLKQALEKINITVESQ